MITAVIENVMDESSRIRQVRGEGMIKSKHTKARKGILFRGCIAKSSRAIIACSKYKEIN